MSGLRPGNNVWMILVFLLVIAASSRPVAAQERIQVILQFDDTWRSQYYNALPVLEEYNFTATFMPFVIDHGRGFGGNQGSYMTWDEIIDLQQRGMEIGSQGWSHPEDMTKLSEDDIIKEVIYSKDELEKHGLVIYGWTYPNDVWNKNIMSIVKETYTYSVPQSYMYERRLVPKDADRHSLEGTAVTNELMSEFRAYLEGVDKNNTIILIYHEIENTGGKVVKPVDSFREQMKYLYENGYTGVSFRDYFGLAEKEPGMSDHEMTLRIAIALVLIIFTLYVFCMAGK